MKNDWSKVLAKFSKYIGVGFATAIGLTYTTGTIPVELQIVITSIVLAGYNALKHEFELKLA